MRIETSAVRKHLTLSSCIVVRHRHLAIVVPRRRRCILPLCVVVVK